MSLEWDAKTPPQQACQQQDLEVLWREISPKEFNGGWTIAQKSGFHPTFVDSLWTMGLTMAELSRASWNMSNFCSRSQMNQTICPFEDFKILFLGMGELPHGCHGDRDRLIMTGTDHSVAGTWETRRMTAEGGCPARLLRGSPSVLEKMEIIESVIVPCDLAAT